MLLAGSPGADGAEYRTRRENYARIVLHGDIDDENSWFEVFSADGTISTLGNGCHSNVLMDGQSVEWLLRTQRDRHTNTIAYQYLARSASVDNGGPSLVEMDVEVLPLTISYAGYGATEGRRTVQFEYEQRPSADQHHTWTFGRKVELTQRLSQVQVKTDANTTAQTYAFHYADEASGPNNVSRRSLLASIQACDQFGQCLPATQFEWDDGVTGFSDTPAFGVDPSTWDGLDFPPYPERPGIFDTVGLFRRVVLDVNGDGAHDLAYAPTHGVHEDSTWRIWLAPGPQGTFESPADHVDTGIVADALYNVSNTPNLDAFKPESPSYAVDYNGDGRDDLAHWWHDAECVSGNCGIDDPLAFGWSSYTMQGTWSSTIEVLVSVDGPQGEPTFTRVYFDDPSGERTYFSVFPDLDGDGFNDVLSCRGPDLNNLEWAYALNRPGAGPYGRVFEFGPSSTGVRCSVYGDEHSIFDYDGDGATELLVVPYLDGSGAVVPDLQRTEYYALEVDREQNTGTGVLAPTGLPRDRYQRWRNGYNAEAVPNGSPLASKGRGRDKLGDFNGDGLVDVVRVELAKGDSAGEQPDILEFFVDPDMDGTYEPVSQPLSEDVGARIYWNTGDGFVVTIQGGR